MRKSLPAVLAGVLLFVSACGEVGSSPNHASTSPSQPPAAAHIVLTDCGATINSPGVYSLNSNLTTVSGDEPCISITGTDNVTLDCNGNSITGLGQYGISAEGVSGLIIQNCNIATGIGNGISILLGLDNVIDATVAGSSFGSNQSNLGRVMISDSVNVTFGGPVPSAPLNPSVTVDTNPSVSNQIANAPAPINTVYGSVIGCSNVNLTIEGNALTSGALTTSFSGVPVIGIFGGQNTHVVNNTVNGLASLIPVEENGYKYPVLMGSDDDIQIQDETGPGSLISGNLLVNNCDFGIETIGFMKNITISNNYVDRVLLGFGGLYYLSVSNAQYIQNTLTNIEYTGFAYSRSGGLRSAGERNIPFIGYLVPLDLPAETTINFTQNQFTGNVLTQPLTLLDDPVPSLEIGVYTTLDYITNPDLPGTDPTPQQFITVDNTFTNNAFDKSFFRILFVVGATWSYTSDDVIDGGGNICPSSEIGVPPVSPTFGKQTSPLVTITPINCGSGN